MEKPESNIPHSPKRQSPVAILIILLKFFTILIKQAWPLLVFYFIRPSSRFESVIITLGLGAGFGSAIVSIISYFNFYYAIQGDELLIKKGLISKTRLNIPFDRIQAINIQQNPIHRFFGVVGLEVDTAGSAKQEANIMALSREEAEAIREVVFSRKGELRAGDEETTEEAVETKEQLIFELSPNDLFRIGVTQNHLKGIGIVIGAFFGVYQFGEDIVGDKKMDAFLKSFFGSDVNSIFMTILQLLPLILILAVLISIVNTLLRYFNLQFLKTAHGFKSIAGLFTRREQAANLNKIQFIEWERNILMKQLGLFTLQLKPAASALVKRSQNIFVPGCRQAHIDALKLAYFGPVESWPEEEHQVSPLIILRRTLYRGLLPALLLMFMSRAAGPYTFLWLLLIPISYWANRRYHRRWKYYVNDKGILTNKGFLSDRATLLQWYKIQSVAIQQSIYQRRKDLADIYFYTAAGAIRIPYIELEKARVLRDFALYQIEGSRESWM